MGECDKLVSSFVGEIYSVFHELHDEGDDFFVEFGREARDERWSRHRVFFTSVGTIRCLLWVGHWRQGIRIGRVGEVRSVSEQLYALFVVFMAHGWVVAVIPIVERSTIQYNETVERQPAAIQTKATI